VFVKMASRPREGRFHLCDEFGRESCQSIAFTQLDQPPTPDVHNERAALGRQVFPPQHRVLFQLSAER
jgi:hypothetical protein